MNKPKLTVKQQRFVDFYDGNATDAARKAGYANPRQAGARTLSNVVISDLIKKREKKRNGNAIMTRLERQVFWTNMVLNAEKDSDKLKASELLGRSEADFTDKIKDDSDPKEMEMTGPLGALLGKVYVKSKDS